MAINLVTLTIGKPTFTDNAGTAEIDTIPITLGSAFDNDLDNVLVTKVFKVYNSGTGVFDAISPTDYIFSGSSKTVGVFTYSANTKLDENDIIQIRLYETDLEVAEDTNDTSFVVQDLFTTFDASGDVATTVPFELPATSGEYKFELTQTNETAPASTIISALTTQVNNPINTAAITINTNDYVDKIAGDVVLLSIADGLDAESATFVGDYRTAFKAVKQ